MPIIDGKYLPESIMRDLDVEANHCKEARALFLKVCAGSTLILIEINRLVQLEDNAKTLLSNLRMQQTHEWDTKPLNGYYNSPLVYELRSFGEATLVYINEISRISKMS